MTKETEEEVVYADCGYIPSTDLTQDEIDKVKQMIDRLNSTECLFSISGEELKE